MSDKVTYGHDPKAIVCRREVNGEQGGATVHMVMLADGFLIDCGSSGLAANRAKTIAAMLNEAGPGRLDQEALSGPCPF